MGTMNAEMVLEDIEIALSSGRCPACGSPLLVRESDGDVLLSCGTCSWRGGIGGGLVRMKLEDALVLACEKYRYRKPVYLCKKKKYPEKPISLEISYLRKNLE